MRKSSRLAIEHLAFYRVFDLGPSGKPIPQVDMYGDVIRRLYSGGDDIVVRGKKNVGYSRKST